MSALENEARARLRDAANGALERSGELRSLLGAASEEQTRDAMETMRNETADLRLIVRTLESRIEDLENPT